MDRDVLIDQMRDAASPDEMSEATYEARMWLMDHPDDREVADAMASLFASEHSALNGG